MRECLSSTDHVMNTCLSHNKTCHRSHHRSMFYVYNESLSNNLAIQKFLCRVTVIHFTLTRLSHFVQILQV